MRLFVLLLIFKILLFCYPGLSCNNAGQSNKAVQDTVLYQHWIHSFEEDKKDKKLTVYRPSGFNFPPARGREGFEIKRNGIFIWHPISPLDGNDTIEETWNLKDHKIMIIGKENKVFKIIELTKDKLIITKLD